MATKPEKWMESILNACFTGIRFYTQFLGGEFGYLIQTLNTTWKIVLLIMQRCCRHNIREMYFEKVAFEIISHKNLKRNVKQLTENIKFCTIVSSQCKMNKSNIVTSWRESKKY